MKKLRVLQFISSGGMYGAEFWILALIKNLNPHDIESYVAAPIDVKNEYVQLLNIAKDKGFKIKSIKMHWKFNPLGILKLIKIIKKERIDIIHAHGYKSNIMGIIAAKMANIKAVTTPHGFENTKGHSKLRYYLYLDRMVYRFFDYIVPLSEELSSIMEKYKIRRKKIKLILNGIDLDDVEKERSCKIDITSERKKERIIGYIGQLIPRKNVYDIIKGFDIFVSNEKNKDFRLNIVGDGVERVFLENYAKSLKSSSYIKFFGYRNDRLNLLKRMDIFTMTSSLEGIPRCIMEAMAIGIPVAAYNISGINSLIINNQTGFLANYGDIKGLVDCWEKIFKGKFVHKITENARNHIINNFSAKRMAIEYTNLYQQL